MKMALKRRVLTGLAVIVFVIFLPVIASFAETINYGYDKMGRLIRAGYEDGTVVEYTYDKMGNRLQKVTTTATKTPTPTPTPAATSTPKPTATTTPRDCKATAIDSSGDDELTVGDTGEVTVTVTANGSDCALSGFKVKAKLTGDGKKAVFSDTNSTTTTATTDHNGEAAFEVLAKKQGSVNIKFTVTGSDVKNTFRIEIRK